MTIDKVMVGILSHYFRAAADAMGFVLQRTAHTTFIKESTDFATGLLTPRGEHFAYCVSVGERGDVGIDFSHLLETCGPWHPGDVLITNCPYLTKGVSTHLPDYHLIKPIFVGEVLVAFAWGFVHSSDMGGIVAGSILPSAYDLFQEGIRIPPLKLYRSNELQEDVKSLLLANVRIPDKNWGDISALVAALGIGEQRVRDAVDKWGLPTVVAGIESLVDYAEARARALLDRIPDGTYTFQDYLEDDVISDMPVRVKLKFTKVPGGEVHLDFTGTDPQLSAAFNLASAGRHPYMCSALFAYFCSVDPTIPLNGGLMRPIHITAPEGSLVNAVFPAPCGVRYAVTQLIFGIIQGILAQALPGAIPAVGAGQATILAISLLDSADGRRHVTVVQPMIGGSGGRPTQDGVEGSDFSLGSLANTSTESLESEIPILVREYSVIPDSGGAGQYRGGVGLRLDFQVFQPDSIVTARGMERVKFQPWGLYGGLAGTNGNCWLNPGKPNQRRLGKINMVRLDAGDILSIRTPGGGGYGDPLDRAPEDVLRDVLAGFVSMRCAEQTYGVVIRDQSVCIDETNALRARLRAERQQRHQPTAAGEEINGVVFDYGDARRAHEAIFSAPVADTLAELIFTLPIGLRYHAKAKMFESIRGAVSAGQSSSPDLVRSLWPEVVVGMGLDGWA